MGWTVILKVLSLVIKWIDGVDSYYKMFSLMNIQ